MSGPKISLEQWRALIAVVDAGGYAQAAAALHKSQSAVTYAVQKLQSLLGVQAFEIQGRKAVLTEAGQVLYRRGLALLEEATRLERAATNLAQGWEPELSLAVETIFPTWLLLDCLNRFAAERPETRIELYETVLGGTDEAVLEGRADVAIASRIPVGFSGSRLRRMRFVCAAAPQHPLHQLGRPVSYEDLRRHRHLVIRDSGTQRTREGNNWLGAEQRWTVSNKATSIRAATLGLGFAWYAENIIRHELARDQLRTLEVIEGSERFAELYLILPLQDASGPGAKRLAELIREGVSTLCVEEEA